MPLHLRQVGDLEGPITRLRVVRYELENAGNGTGDVTASRDRYLSTLESVDAQLRSIFDDPAIWNHIHSEQYWAIRDLTPTSPRPMPLIFAEAKQQVTFLESLMSQLQKLQVRLGAAEGRLAVLDTHVLLHFQPLRQIKWSEVIGETNVRLVLPLRVVEELDERKYRGDEVLADRARRLLSEMWGLLAATKGGPVQLRDGITVEVPVGDEPRQRTLDADTEILYECELLKAVNASPVLVTGDTGLSLRAVSQGLTVVPMPERYLRRRPKSEPDDPTETSAAADVPG